MLLKKEKTILFLFVCILYMFLFSFNIAGENEVIKVGFPFFKGFSEIKEDGSYTGYTYEYLQEIAKYTGWKYEFIPGTEDDLSEMIDMLQKGDLDILGGMVYNEQTSKVFDFPEYNCGTSYATILVRSDESRYNETDYQTFNGMKIGVLNSSTRRTENLSKFCNANGILVELIYYDDSEKRLLDLQDRKIDAILSSDMDFEEDHRIIARFASDPYYFATTKNNKKVLSGLNSAISKIKEVNANYDLELYNKYFKKDEDYTVILTNDEKEYIKNSKVLTVVTIPDFAPIQIFDKNTGHFTGIISDIFDIISEETGLKFRFLKTNSYKESLDMIAEGKADIIAGVIYDYNISEKYNITIVSPYLNLQNVLIKNKNADIVNGKNNILALPLGFNYKNGVEEKNIKYYNNLEDCIKAINEGIADYSYASSYAVEYYIKNKFYNNISSIPLTESSSELSVGIKKPTDTNLITIITKAVNSISDNELQLIVYKNAANINKEISFKTFIYSNPTESVLFVVGLCFIIIFVVLLIMYIQMQNTKKIKLESERYKILSEMSDEIIFEYDFILDRLVISDKYSELFNHGKVINNYYNSLKKGISYSCTDSELLINCFKNNIKSKNSSLEVCCILKNEVTEWFRSDSTIIFDEFKKPLRAIGKLISIEKEKQEKEMLIEKSQTDLLTKIYNRSTSEELIIRYLEKKSSDVLGALLIIDLDYFKSVNDNLGHKAGDDVLIDIASTLKNIFRKDDIIGRWGGDEFVVFMKDIRDKQIVIERAEKLCKSMNKEFLFENKKHQLSISVGIAIADKYYHFNELYQKADKALYKVKESGRNGFKIYN